MKSNKNIVVLLMLACLSHLQLFAQKGSNAENAPLGSGEYSIVYVENSSSGLAEKVKNNLFDRMDSIAQNPFLLYLSNSTGAPDRKSDFYTTSKSSTSKRLSILDAESLPSPELITDKSELWKILTKSEVTSAKNISLHFYFTSEYINDFLLKESSASSMLCFFPKELSLVAKNAPVTVNIYFSEQDPKKLSYFKTELTKKVLFKNEGLFENKGLNCNIITL